MTCAFVTHPEVVIDPSVPIEQWRLSAAGLARAARGPEILGRPGMLGRPDLVVSSAERKAIDTADVLGRAWGLDTAVDPDLGEMDRSSTGYLEPSVFESVVDAFFAAPERSVHGWERAMDAQRRIERAVRAHVERSPDREVVFVSHGGVGALLLASLHGVPINRELDQPGMGSVFTFDPVAWRVESSWTRLV